MCGSRKICVIQSSAGANRLLKSSVYRINVEFYQHHVRAAAFVLFHNNGPLMDEPL